LFWAVAVMRDKFTPGDLTAVSTVDRMVAGGSPRGGSVSEPVAKLGTAYSSPQAKATPWSEASEALTRAELFWLSTVRPDGQPHVTPLLAVWHDAALYFTTGDQERKAENLRANPQCVATTGTNTLDGLDLVIEGTATAVTDAGERDTVATAYGDKYGEHVTGADGTWHGLQDAIRSGDVLLYRVRPTVAFAFGKGSVYSQTRYTFS
jgi:general stress protein 26